MTEHEAREFIVASRWRFARTMPQNPHFYTLRKDAEDDDQFVSFVEFIRSHGYDEVFGKTTYRYLDIDGWQYWTMGFVTDSTTLINRAETNREDRTPRLNPKLWFAKSWPQLWCREAKALISRR